MSRVDDKFIPALEGKHVPILVLDNKWYKLISSLDIPDGLKQNENKLKEALKAQGRINSKIKEIRKLKKRLMNEVVGNMDNDAAQEGNIKERIDVCNKELEELETEIAPVMDEIEKLNYNLMLDTMELCYDSLNSNTETINEIADWIREMRIELKKNVVRKQEREFKNFQMYSYMHDIFGPEVIDIFDMKYNPETEHVLVNRKDVIE